MNKTIRKLEAIYMFNGIFPVNRQQPICMTKTGEYESSSKYSSAVKQRAALKGTMSYL